MVATKRVHELSAVSAIVGTDLALVVKDPTGTPDEQKATWSQVATFLNGLALWQPQGVSDTHANRLLAAHVAGRLWRETDTGVIYYDNGVTWDLWKSEGGVRKTANEIVNASAALQNDNHLFFPIEANEVWYYEATLMATTPSVTADLKAAWSLPAGATFNIIRQSAGSLGIGSNSNMSAISNSIGINSATNLAVFVGWITNGATAGTANFQWCQDVSTAEDTTVLANSFLRLRRVA